jgi:zinc protease
MYVKYYSYIFALLLTFFITGVRGESPQALLKIEHWYTQNGIPVYFVAKKQIPIIDIGLLFHAGSSQDNSSPGIAQFTAQMLDQGTQNLTADQIANHFEAVGAHYGAGINQDMTVLNLRSLSATQFFNPAFSTFSGLIKGANFPQSAINRIKKQTLISLQQESQTPSIIAAKTFYRALYGQHPYASSLLGNKASIEQLSQEKIVNFYRHHYVAKNAMIAIVGDINKDKAVSIAEQLAAALPKGQESTPPATPLPPALKNRVIKVAYPSQQTTIFLGQLGIAVKDANYFPLLIGNQILGGGILTSRLFNEVRNKRGLCYDINSGFKTLQVAGPFLIVLQTRRDQAANALAVTEKTLKDFLVNGPSTQELLAAKQALTGSFPFSFASNESILAAIEKIAFYQLPLNYLDTYPEKIAAVSLEQVRNAFQKIKPDKMVIIMLGKK